MERGGLTDYEKYVFNGVENKMKINAIYSIDVKRKDYEDFISAIKKRIDLYGDCEFNSDYTKFRKIIPFEEELEYWKNSDSNKVKQLKKKK